MCVIPPKELQTEPVTTYVHEQYDPATWLLEEYKLLTKHYFHEDNQYWKTISIFGTLNGALLAFLGSHFVDTETLGKYFVPIIGCVFSISWVFSLIRIREWRNYIEQRIKIIEEHLHGLWADKEFRPLDLRIQKDWQPTTQLRWFRRLYYRIRDFPASVSLLILPCSFLIVWIVIIVLQFT